MSADSRDSESVEDFGDCHAGEKSIAQRFRWIEWNQRAPSRITGLLQSSLIPLSILVLSMAFGFVGKYDKIPVGLSNDPLKNRIHVDHCLEALRISLMCFADVTPLMVRIGGPAGARADFNTHHKCRNFDKISDWIDENWTVR
ncbi:hypothetical protein COL154_010382 [Colletotrichum chrysophilum]|nr:hypothetical protein COL154_010382 [Colletotrichum chrysophilum]